MKQELKKKIIQKKYLEGNQNLKTLPKNNSKKITKQKEVKSISPSKFINKKTATIFKNKVKKKKNTKNLKQKLWPQQSKRRKQTELESLEDLFKQKTLDNTKKKPSKQQELRFQKTFRKTQNKQKPQKSQRKTAKDKDLDTKRKKSTTRKITVQQNKKKKLKSQGDRKKKIQFQQDQTQKELNSFQKLKKAKSQPIIEKINQYVNASKIENKYITYQKTEPQKQKLLKSERQLKDRQYLQKNIQTKNIKNDGNNYSNQIQKVLQQEDQIIFKREKRKNQQFTKQEIKNLTIRNVYQIGNFKKKPQQVFMYNQRKKNDFQNSNSPNHQQNNSIQQILKISESKKNRAKIILQFKNVSAITIQRWWRKILNSKKIQTSYKKSQINIQQQTFEEKNQQVNNLKELVQVYDNIQSEQKHKWKSLYYQIKNIEKKQKDNPIVQQIKKQSLQNIKNLRSKNLQNLQQTNQNKFKHQNYSLDSKIQEKFVDQNQISQKTSYMDFRKKIYDQHISKSMILLKKSQDRSFDLTLSHLNLKIDTKKTTNKKLKQTNKDTYKKEHLASQITQLILEQEIEEIFEKLNLQKFRKENKTFPFVQTDIYTIHTFLNQVSEFLIFNHLNSIKNRLNYCHQDSEEVFCNNKILKNSFFVNYKKVCTKQKEQKVQNYYNNIFKECIYNTLDISMMEQIVNPYPGIIKFNFFCTNLSFFNLSFNEDDLDNSIQLSNKNIYDDIGTISALEKACNQLLNWNDIMCGVIIKQQNSLSQKEQEQYLKQVREERLQKLMENDIREKQNNWQIDREQISDILEDIQNDVLDFLIEDLAYFL